MEEAYTDAVGRIERLAERLDSPLLMERRAAAGQVEDSPTYTSNMSQERYEAMVEQVKEYIYAGDIIQAVPSQRLARPTKAAPLDIYRALRALNPSPYMYYLSLDGFSIVGASPELLVRVDDGLVYNFPLAGTRPRGTTTEEDEALAAELKADEKERAEHIMLVDLGRNDVGACLPTRHRGGHRPHEGGALLPRDAPGVGGAGQAAGGPHHLRRPSLVPARRDTIGRSQDTAMEIISEQEGERRGPYGGAVGYFSFSGNMDTAITIRTMVIKDGVAYIQAGGGVVADSVPESEYQETLHKGAVQSAGDRGGGAFRASGPVKD